MRVVGGDRRVQVAGLEVHSLCLSFLFPSVFCSFPLPPYALQLPGLGWAVSPSAPILFSFLFISLALMRADPAMMGVGIRLII